MLYALFSVDCSLIPKLFITLFDIYGLKHPAFCWDEKPLPNASVNEWVDWILHCVRELFEWVIERMSCSSDSFSEWAVQNQMIQCVSEALIRLNDSNESRTDIVCFVLLTVWPIYVTVNSKNWFILNSDSVVVLLMSRSACLYSQ